MGHAQRHRVTLALSQVKEEGLTKDAKAAWAKATLLTRQTTNLSDVKHPHYPPAVSLSLTVSCKGCSR